MPTAADQYQLLIDRETSLTRAIADATAELEKVRYAKDVLAPLVDGSLSLSLTERPAKTDGRKHKSTPEEMAEIKRKVLELKAAFPSASVAELGRRAELLGITVRQVRYVLDKSTDGDP